MKNVIYIVSGRVQGVGYRSYVQTLAKKHHIKGSVKNLPSGKVEIIAQAESNDLANFKKAIQQPQHCLMKIEKIEENLNNTKQLYTGFNISY